MERRMIIMLGVITFMIAVLWVLVGVGGAEGVTITVDDDGGADYEKIQDAIDNATDWDTIRVFNGTYYENVIVDKSVSIIGNGSEVTTIDGGGIGDVVMITADWVNMSGFLVTGSGISWPDAGINIESNNNNIFRNNCSNNSAGIYLSYSSYCAITNNTCSNNHCGIYLSYSSYCQITNNACSNNSYGIILVDSGTCILENNNCSNNDRGINLWDSNDCTLTNNSMVKNGISISGSLENWNSHTIDTTNMVNGKPVYYYKNVTGFTIPNGAGQVILANCTWINVENQNCSNGGVGIMVGFSSNILLNNNTCSSNYYGIYVESSKDSTFENNSCSLNSYGIFLVNSTLNIISQNLFHQNGEAGIALLYSHFNSLYENECQYNYHSRSIIGQGISLSQSNHNSIEKNNCSHNGKGILLEDSTNNTVIENYNSENRWGGIELQYCENTVLSSNTCHRNGHSIFGGGICLSRSRSSMITNNNCTENFRGIILQDSHQNVIKNNLISHNNEDGICIWSSDNNYVETNSISNNREGVVVAYGCYGNRFTNNRIFQNSESGMNATKNEGSIVDARYNWWGDSTGPNHYLENPNGTGDKVTDEVLFSPWLTMNSNALFVDDEAPPGGDGSLRYPFNRIQHAIDNATDWDTIRVFNGTYYENIIVNKSLSLIGNGSADTKLENDRRDDIVQIEVDNITVSGFTIRSTNDSKNHGIVITSNNVYIHNNNLTENFEGIQIKYYNHGIRIVNNSFFSNVFYAISSYGVQHSTIEKNTFISQSVLGIYLWNCSLIKIIDNQFLFNRNSGILLEDSHNNTIEKNNLMNNSIGITLKSTLYGSLKPSIDNSIHNNTFMGNENSGINATRNMGFSVNAFKNWWGHSSGPYHSENNSMGRGDNVTDYVDFEPWLDEHGNLVYLPNEPDDDDDEPNRIPLYILLGILMALFTALAVVAHTSGLTSTSKAFKTRQLPASEPTWDSSDVMKINGKMITCEYCHQGFDVAKNEKAIRVPCPKCGKYTLNS